MLKGYDALMNLVLDDVQEVLRGELSPFPGSGQGNADFLPFR
jgi:small nuclear ribonucleoprotein (snRNP)-like protein